MLLKNPLVASGIAFTAAGAGAVIRTVQSKERDDISVMDFILDTQLGNATAVTDGCQAALDAAGTSGRSVYFPGYAFDISDSLDVPSDVTVRGSGLITQTVANKNIFNVIARENVNITGVTMRGTGTNGAEQIFENVGVYVSSSKNTRIDAVDISSCNGSGILFNNSFNQTVTNSNLHDNLWLGSNSYASAADILFWSTVIGSAGRTIITNNFLTSNNSQAIANALLGVDEDSLISGNIIVTLQDGVLVADGGVRRHGIMVNYQSQSPNLRAVVSNNIIGNTLWTGIYSQRTVTTSGPVLIDGNYIFEVGYDTANFLTGAVYVNSAGPYPVVVSNNMSVAYKNSTNATGAFTCNGEANNNNVQFIDNHSVGSLSSAYAIAGYSDTIEVSGGSVQGSTRADFFIALSNGSTADNGIRIKGVSINRSIGAEPMFYFDPQTATSQRLIITDCDFEGVGVGVADVDNCVVFTRRTQSLDFYNNRCRNVYLGISTENFLAANTRYFNDFIWGNNRWENVNTAYLAGAAAGGSSYIVSGDIFINVTTKTGGNISGSANSGYIGTREGSNFTIFDVAAAPAAGTWAVGDRFISNTPVVGSPEYWSCTVAGSPGTIAPVGITGGVQSASVASPIGGATVDNEARAAIDDIILKLKTAKLMVP